jgi:hypothetical protein
MPKKQDGTKEPITTHGGYRWSKPPEQRRVRINVTLAPDVIELLAPFVRTGERGKKIDQAIRAYFQKDQKS